MPRSKTALVVVIVIALGSSAHAQDVNFKCRETISKSYTNYVKTITKIVEKCNDAQVKIGNGQNAPGGTLAACDTSGKIPAALTKMTGKINGACTGISLSTIGWPGTCPNIEGGTCTNAIADGTDTRPVLIASPTRRSGR